LFLSLLAEQEFQLFFQVLQLLKHGGLQGMGRETPFQIGDFRLQARNAFL
jgi:hypothetical protein